MSLPAYFLRQAETRAARADWERAAALLELAHIRERLAELDSQHEPLNTMAGGNSLRRAKMIAVARYVVTGKW